MKKTKILTVMGVLLAMGITACGGNNKKSSSSETPVPSSQSSQPAPSSSSQTPSSSSQTPSSSSQTPVPAGDPTGHNWGADADVAASGEGVAYKKASCTDNDGFLKLTINQSQVTYASGSKRKSNTPEGYTKLDGNNQSMSVKFNYDSYAKGKLYLYGCMDGWSSNASKQAFSYNGSPNIEVKVNGTALDIAALSEVIYTDFLSGDASDLSDDGYGYIGDITIHEGVNEISYKRLASMNTLIKDFVLVVKNEEHTHEFTEWAQDKAPTCTDLGSKSRSCACGLVEQADVNTLAHDLDAETEVIKLNSDKKKVSQFDCKVGSEKVAAIPMKEISGIYPTTAVEGEKEKWTIGEKTDKAAADTYKMDKGTALLFKVSVSKAVSNAFISIGAKFSNANPRHFYNHGDGGQNGDNPDGDAWRYYTKVNNGEFIPMSFNDLMSAVFGDGKSVCYMPLGKFNLQEGENLIYIRQSNLGYRVTLQDYLLIALGDATVSGDSPSHAHQAGTEWKSDEKEHWHECVAADCDEEGIKLDKASHTFSDWAEDVAPTCTTAGSEKRACTVCGYEETRTLQPAHDWDEAVAVAADGENVAYNKFSCKKCGAIKVEVELGDSMLASGSSNKNDPYGYMKLSGNGQSFSFKFNYACSGDNNVALGKLYQRGVLDNWGTDTANTAHTMKCFSSGKADGTGADDCELTLNSKKIDLSAYKSKTYAEFMVGDPQPGKKGEDKDLIDDYLSPVADIESGNNIVLNNGANTFKYERKGSYNMALTHIVFVVNELKHTHEAAAEWSKDETSHWHACSDANCPIPGAKLDEAEHTWGEKYDEIAGTCSVAGSYKQACTVCGYVKTVETGKAEHTWGEAQTAINDAVPHECSVCHAMCYELDLPSPQKVKADVDWNVTGLPAGTYEVYAKACASSSTLSQNMQSRYQFGFDGNYVALGARTAYSAFNFGTGEDAASAQWSSKIMEVTAGENAAKFSIHWVGSGYSAFFASIRLVKIA